MEYSKATADLIERQCKNVEREDFVLDKPLSEELILKTYDLFNLPRPSKVEWSSYPLSKKFQDAVRSAWSAGSAGSAGGAGSARSAGSAWSAWSAWSARSAGSALDYDFDWYVFEFEYCQNPDKDLPPNENDRKYLEYCELLMQAKEAGLGYRVEWEDTLYLAPTPLVKINDQNQFHSGNSPAIRWKNSKEEYFYLNGVNFPKKLFQQVTSGDMPFQDILAIKDIDQRTQAMKFGDVLEFLKHTRAVQLDKYVKKTPSGGIISYRLYRIPKGDIFTTDAYYLVYNDPSTMKQYMSGVEPCGTVAEGMSWKFGITPKEWEALIPLVSES